MIPVSHRSDEVMHIDRRNVEYELAARVRYSLKFLNLRGSVSRLIGCESHRRIGKRKARIAKDRSRNQSIWFRLGLLLGGLRIRKDGYQREQQANANLLLPLPPLPRLRPRHNRSRLLLPRLLPHPPWFRAQRARDRSR